MAGRGEGGGGGGALDTITYGDRARDLIAELRGTALLPAYNDSGVRAVVAEMTALAGEIRSHGASDEPTASVAESMRVTLSVFHEAILRNRRCLLAYHHRRCDILDDMRWRHGGQLPVDVRDKCSSLERDYFNAYSDLLGRYMEATGVDIMSGRQPPKHNIVEVLVMRDIGELVTTTGAREVKAGEVHCMQIADAEDMIRRGWLKHITDTDP